MGEVPDWYLLLVVAEKLNCAPWELLDQRVAWFDIGIMAINAEAAAKKNAGKRRRR